MEGEYDEDERTAGPATPHLTGGDYYAILNVPRDVTDEDLRASYRRLCVLFHPDKHTNAEDKEAAERNFRSVNEAYEVLSDANRRAIYDIYGVEGLKAGWELGPRLKSQQEIREEYERKKRQKEEDDLRRLAASKGEIQVSIDATPLLHPYTTSRSKHHPSRPLQLEDMLDFQSPEIKQQSMTQSVQMALGQGQTCALTCSLLSRNFTGGGFLSFSYANSTRSSFTYDVSVLLGNTSPNLTAKVQVPLPYGTVGIVNGGYGLAKGVFSASVTVFRPLTATTNGFITYQNDDVVANKNSMVVGTTYVSEKITLRPTLQLNKRAYTLELAATYKVDSETKLRASGSVGTASLGAGVGIERVLTEHLKAVAMFEYNATGGVYLKLKFFMHKIGQSISLPILLSPEITTTAVMAGLVFPMAVGYALKKFILDPRKRRARQREVEQLQRDMAEHTAQKRKEAEESVRLMTEFVQRKLDAEAAKNGLVIVEASYGRLDPAEDESDSIALNTSPKVFDVKIALQSLVHNSQLHLHGQSKSMLIGFYDPCVGETKKLKIVYMFKRRMHKVIVNDDETVSLPLRAHVMSE